MPDSACWDVICGADGGQVVLCVDFPARPPGAGFTRLARSIGAGYRFLQFRGPIDGPDPDGHGDGYVPGWLESIRRDGCRIGAVLGYDVGNVYAAEIASGISRWQPLPELILFDPRFPSPDFLKAEFQQEIDSISSLLSDAEIEHSAAAADEFWATPADTAGLAYKASRTYREISVPAFERAGIGGSYEGKLIAPFESHLAWISAARTINPVPMWKRSVAIESSDYPGIRAGFTGDGAVARAPGCLTARRIPFDVPHPELLRSESVAGAVRDLLTAGELP